MTLEGEMLGLLGVWGHQKGRGKRLRASLLPISSGNPGHLQKGQGPD